MHWTRDISVPNDIGSKCNHDGYVLLGRVLTNEGLTMAQRKFDLAVVRT